MSRSSRTSPQGRPAATPRGRREPVCPLGICDGSGFVDRRGRRTPRATASAAPRGSPRPARAASRGGSRRRYRGVSFERPPVSDIARSAPDAGPGGAPLRRATSTQNLDARPRAVARWATSAPARRRSRCSSPRPRSTPGRSVAIYSLPRLLNLLRESMDSRRRAGRLPRPARRGRPAAHRRPRRREPHRLGARAALLDRQRALRGRAGDRGDHQPDARRARASSSARAPSRGWWRSAATRSRCSARTGAAEHRPELAPGAASTRSWARPSERRPKLHRACLES